MLSGVLLTQIVNSAVHLAQPLLIADLSGSLGSAAFFSAFGTAVHMLGTYLGGWPTERFGARRVLVASTLLRGVALAGIPSAMAFGFISLPWAMGSYTAEALIRGYVDTSVHTVPLELAGHRGDLLDKINSRYELFFEVGAVAGPLMLSGVMVWSDGIVPHIVIPIGFAFRRRAICSFRRGRATPMPAKCTGTGHTEDRGRASSTSSLIRTCSSLSSG